MSAPMPSGPVSALLSPAIREHLGAHLRLAYGAVEASLTPEPMLGALARLEAVLRERGETLTEGMRSGLAAAAPGLRNFALSLARNESQADDLVQETMLKAWKNRERFEPGTNLSAWLFTILRNQFYTDIRKRQREVEDADGTHSAKLSSAPSQGAGLDIRDMQVALDKLSPEQREALMLVAVSDVTYEEAAAVMGCKVGTIKSRVCRGRDRLAELLGYDPTELGPDRLVRSAMADVAFG